MYILFLIVRICVGFELTMFSLLSGLEQKSRLGKKAPVDL